MSREYLREKIKDKTEKKCQIIDIREDVLDATMEAIDEYIAEQEEESDELQVGDRVRYITNIGVKVERGHIGTIANINRKYLAPVLVSWDHLKPGGGHTGEGSGHGHHIPDGSGWAVNFDYLEKVKDDE